MEHHDDSPDLVRDRIKSVSGASQYVSGGGAVRFYSPSDDSMVVGFL